MKPAYRGRGYGERLMEAAHRFIRENEVAWARLYVTVDNQAAVRLYERLGYRAIRWEMERPV